MKYYDLFGNEIVIENLTISTIKNVYGFYTVGAFVDGYLLSYRTDRKPTQAQAKRALIEAYKRQGF